MKAKKITSVIIATLLTFAVFVLTLSPTATALLDQTGSITLHVATTSGKPLEGTTFRLYYFASAHKAGNGVRYEFVKPYDKANISIENLQDSYLSVHLAHFAVSNSLPYTEKSADKDGLIVFDNLTPGLYLLVPYGNFDGYYMPSPFVINIPEYDSGNQKWEYDIIATPKMLIIDGNAETLTTYISVRKIWETEEERPESITVVLLRDLEEFAEIQLSESNDWYFRWDTLPKNHVWNIVETQVPEGYSVRYETSSNTVTIINKSDSHGQTTTVPDSETQTGVTIPGESTPDEFPQDSTTKSHGSTTPRVTVPDESGQETTTEKDTLVDTGQLNWPVPVLAIAGLLIFSIGWAMLNFGKKETE